MHVSTHKVERLSDAQMLFIFHSGSYIRQKSFDLTTATVYI